MQHNGAGETNGEPPPLSFSAAAPLQMATSRVRRFAQEGRTVPPQPRVMVVFSPASDSENQGDAMSGADIGEEEYRKPVIPVPNLNLGKSLRTLDAPEEVSPRGLKRMCYYYHHGVVCCTISVIYKMSTIICVFPNVILFPKRIRRNSVLSQRFAFNHNRFHRQQMHWVCLLPDDCNLIGPLSQWGGWTSPLIGSLHMSIKS